MDSDRSRIPGTAAMRRTSSGTSRRTSGSPPVMRTRSSPMGAITRTIRSISSYVRSCSLWSQGRPSIGMQ